MLVSQASGDGAANFSISPTAPLSDAFTSPHRVAAIQPGVILRAAELVPDNSIGRCASHPDRIRVFPMCRTSGTPFDLPTYA